jgi:signal transduction histidine kinase
MDVPPPRLFVADIDPEREVATQQKLLDSRLMLARLPQLDRVLRSGRPELVAPDDPDNWPAPFGELRFNASLTLPLLARGSVLGTLTLLPTATSAFSYPQDLVMVEEMVDRCAVAIDNASLFHRTQEAVRARDEFMAVASHELRTPLTPLTLVVQGLHRLLTRGQLVELSQAQLDTSFKNATTQLRRLSQLVDNLLDVTRLRRGELRLTLEETDLAELVAEVVRRYGEALTAARCATALDLQPGVIGRWDALRLEQMLTNLLINAIRYAAGQPIEIRSFARDGKATLEMRDHGPGICKEDQARIFRPFERGVSYRAVSGFGLGLYIVREVVEAHGGRITLESEPGRGCVFVVVLPLDTRPGGTLSATELVQPA